MIKRLGAGILAAGLLLFTCQVVHAQVSASGGSKVSQMSDQQIQQIWSQAQKSGMSENDVMKLLVKKGMDPSDVGVFKKRLVGLQGSSKNGGQTFVRDTSDFLKDTSWVFEVPQQRKKLAYYGYDFFNNPFSSFEPSLIVSPPKSYMIGPGDELTVNVTGVNETVISGRITREGNLEVPHVGVVNLGGLTLDEATRKLKARMQMAYPAIASGKTEVIVTFDKVRSINVIVQGEADKPGRYTVSGLTGLVNVLYLSGGPNLIGSLRKIELIRNGKVVETIDFYSFLQKGILGANFNLQDQDIIRFPVYNKRVMLAGQVKRAAIYELLENETLADLIQYAGGFGDTAYRQSVKVTQLGDQERSIRDVAAVDFRNFIPHNADSVYVDRILPRYSNRVFLSGAVQRPGTYELTKGLTVSKLIARADGVREDAFVNRGSIQRRRADDGSKEILSFDVTKLLSGTANDIPLLREDSVFIAANDSLRDQLSVTVGGSVRTPGVLQFRRGITLEDAILEAGGFSNDAASHRVEISRLEKNIADTLANKLITTLTVDVDPALKTGSAKTTLEPLDYIFVPRLLNYRNLGSIRLRGEVLYAGDYSLERRDETIQELITRAGGVSPYASLKDVQVYRNSLRVAATIFAEGSDQRFLLLPGDSIFIPRNEPFVEVKGFVFTPQILRYDNTRFLSYISGAGGVTDKGNLSKAYIQYSNGINKRIRHFLFFRKYPRVLPGSKIIVPEKTEFDRRTLSVLEISSITGVLTALLAAISLFKK